MGGGWGVEGVSVASSMSNGGDLANLFFASSPKPKIQLT